MKIRNMEKGSLVKGDLPKGCRYCEQGRKMVLLVTGLCKYACFYCPLSEKKSGKEVVYANEKKVEKDEDVIFEAKSIDALGSGITGGEPLEVLDKTLYYIKLLKKEFGDEHHIHLYTALSPDKKILEDLSEAGLDEIRFHPPVTYWKDLPNSTYDRSFRIALKLGMQVGVEVPALPDYKRELKNLAEYLDELGVHFLNLNELEFSETNWDALKEKGYKIRNDISNAIKGSQWAAQDVLKKTHTKMSIHYCSSRFKDGVQLRKRIKRRAKNTKKESDVVTDEGLFIKGIVECDDPKAVYAELKEDFEIPSELIILDEEKNRVEIASWILEEIHKDIEYPCFIVEEYPTADRLEVGRTPLKWPA
jgi:pyruvate formate-lyase activating enzyme-like uncharacterized protein